MSCKVVDVSDLQIPTLISLHSSMSTCITKFYLQLSNIIGNEISKGINSYVRRHQTPREMKITEIIVNMDQCMTQTALDYVLSC
jgi:uncharacterized protein (UPF0179 family)